MGHVEVRVLGSPSVSVDGKPRALVGRPLALVVRLAMANGRAVSKAQLIDDLWPDESGNDGAVRVLLTRARRSLGDGSILRSGNGYALNGSTPDLDRFERLAELAADRSAPPSERVDAAEEAEALWVGDPFAGVSSGRWLANESSRLQLLHERVVDDRLDASLEAGRHREMIPELRRRVAESPLNERRAAQLALALYRNGDQSGALDVIATTRSVLRDELGLHPAPSLRQLEHQILEHDPGLDPLRDPESSDVHAIDAEVRAAITLARLEAFNEAEAILERAEAIAVAAHDQGAIGRVLATRAQVAMMSGGESREPLLRAQAIARKRHDGHLLARCAMIRFGAGIPADKTNALVELTEPIGLLASNAPEQVDLLCAAAMIVNFTDASGAVERLVAEAERIDSRVGTPDSRAVLRVTQSLAASVRMAPLDKVVEFAEESFRLAQGSDNSLLVVVALHALLRARYECGDIAGADLLLEPLRESSADALSPFGVIRAMMARSTNLLAAGRVVEAAAAAEHAAGESARLGTTASGGSSHVQRLAVAIEQEALEAYVPFIEVKLAERSDPSGWNALAALAGDDEQASKLCTIVDRIPVDETFPISLALIAEVAGKRCDVRLAEWCTPRLEAMGSRAIVSGFGTAVMGFASHYAGMTRSVLGDLELAEALLRDAARRADPTSSALWLARSEIELAAVLARRGTEPNIAEARRFVHEVQHRHVVSDSAALRRRCDEVAEMVASAR